MNLRTSIAAPAWINEDGCLLLWAKDLFISLASKALIGHLTLT